MGGAGITCMLSMMAANGMPADEGAPVSVSTLTPRPARLRKCVASAASLLPSSTRCTPSTVTAPSAITPRNRPAGQGGGRAGGWAAGTNPPMDAGGRVASLLIQSHTCPQLSSTHAQWSWKLTGPGRKPRRAQCPRPCLDHSRNPRPPAALAAAPYQAGAALSQSTRAPSQCHSAQTGRSGAPWML